MLRRLHHFGLSAGLLWWTAVASAQAPASMEPVSVPLTSSLAGQYSHDPMVTPVGGLGRGNGNFDAYRHYQENVVAADCQSCGMRKHGYGLLSGLLGEGEDCVTSDCTDAWGAYNVEKRFIFSYVNSNSNKPATRASYNDAHSGQVGVEITPWVVTDGDLYYTRWGILALFDYTNYVGNKSQTLQSRRSGNQLSMVDGQTFAAFLGPVIRTDFEWNRFRFSPNLSVGMTFDWTDVSVAAPTANRVRFVDEFKYTGFDVGAYARLMMDFPVTDQIAVGIGGQFRYAPTDVMMRDEDARKHLGLILQVNTKF